MRSIGPGSAGRSRPGSPSVFQSHCSNRSLRDQFRAADLLHRRGDVPPAARNRGARGGRERGRILSRVRSRAQRAPPGRCLGSSRGNHRRPPERVRVALEPANLLWCFVGVLLGTVVGILRGSGRRDDRDALAAHLQHEPAAPSSCWPAFTTGQVRRLDHFDPDECTGESHRW